MEKITTHAELAAKLLRDAAAFFDTIAEQNEPIRDQMRENAGVYRQVADLVEADPTGELTEEKDGGAGSGLSEQFSGL